MENEQNFYGNFSQKKDLFNQKKQFGRYSNILKQNNSVTNDDDDLFLFGYACKLYRDDEKARLVNSGKHLIPWMGNMDLLIDRFVNNCNNLIYSSINYFLLFT